MKQYQFDTVVISLDASKKPLLIHILPTSYLGVYTVQYVYSNVASTRSFVTLSRARAKHKIVSTTSTSTK